MEFKELVKFFEENKRDHFLELINKNSKTKLADAKNINPHKEIITDVQGKELL